MGVWDYIQIIAVIGVVIYAAYFITKLVAGTSSTIRNSANVKQIGMLQLGRDKSVVLVEIGEYVYILGVGAQHIALLDKLARSELNLVREDGPPAAGFAETFQKELNERLKKLRR